MIFLLYLAQVIRNNPVQEQRLLSPRTSDMAAADAMNLVKVLHQLLTFADAMSPMKGLHKLVTFDNAMSLMKELHELFTLAFISVTYFCFKNKLVWKLTPSPPPFTIKRHIYHFYDRCKSYFIWMTTSLVFLKLNDVVLYYQKKIFLDTQKFHCLWVGHFSGMATNPNPPYNASCLWPISWLAIWRTWIKWLVSLLSSNQKNFTSDIELW